MARSVLLGCISIARGVALNRLRKDQDKFNKSVIFGENIMNTLPWQNKQQWVLTQEALNKLLLQLDSNAEKAAREYETIRFKLVKFFEYRGCTFPEEYADETINRVIKKIESGEKIYTDNYASYFLGFARNILREQWKKIDQHPTTLDALPPSQIPKIDPHEIIEKDSQQHSKEQQLECLQKCLEKLSQDNRELINEYYKNDNSLGIETRKALADRLEISLNNLRIRIHRLKEKLEQCVYKCLAD